MNANRFVGWILTLLVPAIAWSAYVYVSRMIRSFSHATDLTALALSVAIGVVGIVLLNRAPGQRAFAIIVYVMTATAGMYFGMVGSLCYVGDCPR